MKQVIIKIYKLVKGRQKTIYKNSYFEIDDYINNAYKAFMLVKEGESISIKCGNDFTQEWSYEEMCDYARSENKSLNIEVCTELSLEIELLSHVRERLPKY